jgi:hypothetical protein
LPAVELEPLPAVLALDRGVEIERGALFWRSPRTASSVAPAIRAASVAGLSA